MTALSGLAHVRESGGRYIHRHKPFRGLVDCDVVHDDLAAGAGRIGKGGEHGASRGGESASDGGGKRKAVRGVIECRPDHFPARVSNFRTLDVAGFGERLDKSPCFRSDAEREARSSDSGGCHIALKFMSTCDRVRFGNDRQPESFADRSLFVIRLWLDCIHPSVIAPGRSDGRGGVESGSKRGAVIEGL
jgi:hypothetical protein